MERKNVPVYKPELAKVLMDKKFECVDIVPNYKFPGQSVFFFEDLPEVHQIISDYSLEHGREVFKVKNRKIANELMKMNFELLDVSSSKTQGVTWVFKWTNDIHDKSLEIRQSIFEK